MSNWVKRKIKKDTEEYSWFRLLRQLEPPTEEEIQRRHGVGAPLPRIYEVYDLDENGKRIKPKVRKSGERKTKCLKTSTKRMK